MRAPYSLAFSLLATTATGHSNHQQQYPDPNTGVIRGRQSCTAPAPKTWWRAEVEHNGTAPYSTDSTFQYYRNVLQYGADGTGVKDSSGAFNEAINAWQRAGNTVSTRPAYIYVPPGTYLIKKPIQLLVYTSLVGDALNLPTLVADPSLEKDPVINGFDAYQGENGPTKNFYMAVRNFRIDTMRVPNHVPARAMEWSVSQSCSLTNVHIDMPISSGHTGISMTYGGSAVLISDCTFKGGAIGLQVASQQYLLKSLSFTDTETAIFFKWSHVTTIQNTHFTNCRFGIDAARPGSAGTISVVDSSATNCEAGVLTHVSGAGQNSVVLDGFVVSEGGVAVKSSSEGGGVGEVVLGGSVEVGKVWVLGNTAPYNYQRGAIYPIQRPSALLSKESSSSNKYFITPLPQYEIYATSQIINIKGDSEHKVYGDNLHDDGPSINAILLKHATTPSSRCSSDKIIFFPQGIYRTLSTIYIPPGTRIAGEVFSTISGFGDFFSDASRPKPIVKMGNLDETGVAQMSDILVSVGDVLPGAILVQINMAATKPGDVGLWNCVLRVGGSHDTLVNTKCANTDPGDCKAAFALLHVTQQASPYLEGVWGWVADHGLDPHLNPATNPQNIAVGRGALVESRAGTWMVGTSFEHCVLYQYALHRAAHVYIALQQTESPYWQGAMAPHAAPAPWTVNAAYGDPTFDHCGAGGDSGLCRRAWAHYMADSQNVVIHGSALWVFFNGMQDGLLADANCASTGAVCQRNLIGIDDAWSTFWFSLAAKAVDNMVYDTSGGGVNLTTQGENKGAWGGVLAAYLRDTEGPAEDGGTKGGGGRGTGSGSGNSAGDGGNDETKDEDNVGAAIVPSGWGLLGITGLALSLAF